MPIEVKLPELGENVESGQVVRIMVAPGDVIEKGQSIVELETDKAAIEVPASVGGTVEAVLVKMGDVVKVGQVLLTVAAEEAAKAAPTKPPAPAARRDSEATVAPAEKDAIAVDEDEPGAPPPASPPSAAPAKASALRPAPPPEPPPSAPPAPAPPPAEDDEGEAPAPTPAASRLVPASPSVRRLARELGLDVNSVPGSGPAGRVSLDDVKAHARRLLTSGAPHATAPERSTSAPGTAAPAGPPLPDFAEWGEIERQPMSNVRRLTAERMSRAWSVIPQVTAFDHADVTELETLRKRFAESHRQRGVRLTLTPIILKAASIALTEMPQLNASIDMERQEIVLKHYRHIAVAVDTERGLLAPVVRDVDAKGVLALASEVEDLAKRAREKKIQVAELRGASFTVTNLGGIGGRGFSPIVNHPEVAVLGVARGDWTPRLVNGAFVARLMLPLALSYDHRLVDGADGARFLRRMAALLEDPLSWMLDGA